MVSAEEFTEQLLLLLESLSEPKPSSSSRQGAERIGKCHCIDRAFGFMSWQCDFELVSSSFCFLIS